MRNTKENVERFIAAIQRDDLEEVLQLIESKQINLNVPAINHPSYVNNGWLPSYAIQNHKILEAILFSKGMGNDLDSIHFHFVSVTRVFTYVPSVGDDSSSKARSILLKYLCDLMIQRPDFVSSLFETGAYALSFSRYSNQLWSIIQETRDYASPEKHQTYIDLLKQINDSRFFKGKQQHPLYQIFSEKFASDYLTSVFFKTEGEHILEAIRYQLEPIMGYQQQSPYLIGRN